MSQEEFDQTLKSGQYDVYPLSVEEYFGDFLLAFSILSSVVGSI